MDGLEFELARPVYRVIGDVLSRRIRDGSLVPGTVLLEGPVAELFRSSRSPVRQAFAELEEAGLVHRFEGRGVLVGSPRQAPRRVRITAGMLGLDEMTSEPARRLAWQSIYYAVERDLILRSLFGPARVSELALARHLGVGRTVAHEVLTRAQSVGLLNRNAGARWHLIPLDEDRFRQLYELRILVEPFLTRHAAAAISGAMLDEMESGLLEVTGLSVPSTEVLDRLEDALHMDALAHAGRPELLGALERTRCILVAGKHIQAALRGVPLIDRFMGEHLSVVHAMRRRDGEAAAAAMAAHLESSRDKAIERLAAFGTIGRIKPVPYMMEG